MFLPATAHDVDTIARTVWAEARGEPAEGRKAVAAVIGNRAVIAAAWVKQHGKPHPLFGDGHLASAARAHNGSACQFSCWSPGDPNRNKLASVTEADPAFADCVAIARSLAAGRLADPTDGATHYLNEAATLAASGRLPDWVHEMVRTAVIGAHTFFRS